MSPDIQYFNKPMMYGNALITSSNLTYTPPNVYSNTPMEYSNGGGMISMEYIPSPIGFNNGRYGAMTIANNGIIYCMSYKLAPMNMIKIDPTTNIITTFYSGGFPAGGSSVRRSILSPTGTIIYIPTFGTAIIELNVDTETLSTFGTVAAGNNKTNGGVLAPNGKIYCSPYSTTSIIVIDPFTRTTYTFGSFGGGNKWSGAILAPNGKIYCPPYADSRVLVIDPSNDTFYYLKDNINDLAKGQSTAKYWNGTLAYDGKIYCTGYGALNTLVIDPETDTCTSFPPIGNRLGSLFPTTGILASNGKMYGNAYSTFTGLSSNVDNSRIREFDPYTKLYSSIGIPEKLNDVIMSSSGASPWPYGGVCMAPNGKIYFSAGGCNFFAIVSGLPPALPEMWQVPKDLSKLPTSLFNYHSNGNGI